MRTCWHIWRWRHKHQGGTHCAPCCVYRPYRTNAERATRCDRISTIAAVFAWAGLLMLALHVIDVPLNLPTLPAGLALTLAAVSGIVSLLAEQLADRYREADETEPVRNDKVRELLRLGMVESDADIDSPRFDEAKERFDAALSEASQAEKTAAFDALRRHGY